MRYSKLTQYLHPDIEPSWPKHKERQCKDPKLAFRIAMIDYNSPQKQLINGSRWSWWILVWFTRHPFLQIWFVSARSFAFSLGKVAKQRRDQWTHGNLNRIESVEDWKVLQNGVMGPIYKWPCDMGVAITTPINSVVVTLLTARLPTKAICEVGFTTFNTWGKYAVSSLFFARDWSSWIWLEQQRHIPQWFYGALPMGRIPNKITFSKTNKNLGMQNPTQWQGKVKVINPGRLTWNLRIHPWKGKLIFQTIIFRFYVNLRGRKFKIPFQHVENVIPGGDDSMIVSHPKIEGIYMTDQQGYTYSLVNVWLTTSPQYILGGGFNPIEKY